MSRSARVLLLVALAAACARASDPRAPESPAPAPAPVVDRCIVEAPTARAPDTLDLVLDHPVEPSPTPGSGAAWLISAHVYETLVRLDCSGAPQPGLAATWRSENGGYAWTFELRTDAAFWDGSPLSADTIVAHWRGRPAQAARLALAGVDSISVEGDRGIRLGFTRATHQAPALLSDPGLAPTLDRGEPWPVGAGAWRPVADPERGGAALLVPVHSAGDGAPVLRLAAAGGDPRDALDAGADLLTTDSPVALAYAQSRPELATVPLPWSRTYVLLSARPFAPAADASFQESLARDVVRIDARRAQPPFWWETGCTAPPGVPSAVPRAARIAYPAGDPAASALAARLVALGAVGPGGAVLSLPAPDLPRAIADGRVSGVVLSLPRVPAVPCTGRPPTPPGWTVSPLVDTRAHLIARRPLPRLEVDGLGAVRLAPGAGDPPP